MWPFSSNEEEQEPCEHEETELISHELTHPNYVYWDDGDPYVHRVHTEWRECVDCGEKIKRDQKEERVYFTVDKIEEVEIDD